MNLLINTNRLSPSKWGRLALMALACCIGATVSAQTAEQRAQCERIYSPTSGQKGKDVVWVPTPDHLVTAMLTISKVTSNDVVYDLGAGDGKVAIAAAKEFGARAVGIEYNKNFIPLADCLVKAAGVAGKAKVIHGDIFETDFSEATVITMYLLPELNIRLMPILLKMKPGTRVVSHSFSMGDWTPDERIIVRGADAVYLWIVPANVEGVWTLQSEQQAQLVLRLEQKHQAVTGTVQYKGELTTLEEGALRGNEITLRYLGPNGATILKGKVNQNKINASLTSEQGTTAFTGVRKISGD
jgi:SAM-dependent methyltransferase